MGSMLRGGVLDTSTSSGSDMVPFLVGPWSTVQVDPGVWGHGTVASVCYTVKAAALRRVRLRAGQEVHGWYIPGAGIWPPLWDPPEGVQVEGDKLLGLETLQAAWSTRGRSQARRSTSEFEVGLPPCMRPSRRQTNGGMGQGGGPCGGGGRSRCG